MSTEKTSWTDLSKMETMINYVRLRKTGRRVDLGGRMEYGVRNFLLNKCLERKQEQIRESKLGRSMLL